MIKLAISLGASSMLFLLSGVAYLLWGVALGQINPDTPLPAAFNIPMFTAAGSFLFALILGTVDEIVDGRRRHRANHQV